MGTESHGGFKNITISNCAVYPAQTPGFAHQEPEGQSGIAIMTVDGGHIDGVTISNISIQGMACPIFMRLGDRGRIFTEGVPRPKVGTLRNVQISNVVATGAGALASAEVFDPTAVVSFSTVASPMGAARSGHTATLMADGRVLIAGGMPSGGNAGTDPALRSAELFDPISLTFSPTGSIATPTGGAPRRSRGAGWTSRHFASTTTCSSSAR